MKHAKFHIPAPRSQAVSPGAAYCGNVEPFKIDNPYAMRAWIVTLAQLGRASQACPSCLGGMLSDAIKPETCGRAGAKQRNQALTAEQRQAIGQQAATARWTRYRARKADETRAKLTLVPGVGTDPS